MANIKKDGLNPWLVDDANDRITGVKNSDASEKLFVYTDGSQGPVRITDTTASTSTTTGAAVVSGGLGVAGAINVGGDSRFTSTGAITIPNGTTAQRPGTPTAGMIRYNSTRKSPEWYDADATAWRLFGEDILEVEYLVVAGGGSGAGYPALDQAGGGGGAGGFRTNVGGTLLPVYAGTSYTVTVGAGGAKPTTGVASNGNESVFSTISSAGGGRGGYAFIANAGAGGSGGGGAGGAPLPQSGNTPATSPSQGNSGGNGTASGSAPDRIRTGGGGGGASAVGGDGVVGTGGGAGGNGTASSITGSSVTYAGGGGGGYWTESAVPTAYDGGAGGSGGGGKGGGTTASAAGAANTGGGGGGQGKDGSGPTIYEGSAGGSGIVVIRYLGSERATGGTITSSGGYTIHTFTTSGTFALTA